MDEKTLKKLETLIDMTLDAALSERGLRLSQKEALTVIETVAGALDTINKVKTARAQTVNFSPVVDCGSVEKNIKRSFKEVIEELQHGRKPDITMEGLKDD